MQGEGSNCSEMYPMHFSVSLHARCADEKDLFPIGHLHPSVQGMLIDAAECRSASRALTFLGYDASAPTLHVMHCCVPPHVALKFSFSNIGVRRCRRWYVRRKFESHWTPQLDPMIIRECAWQSGRWNNASA